MKKTMEAAGAEVYGSEEQRKRWIDADLRRLAGDGDVQDEGVFAWQPHAVGRNRRDQCFVHKVKGDPVWWIKVVGQVLLDEVGAAVGDAGEDDNEQAAVTALLRNVDNLLDEGLHVRQHEWHQLYVVRTHTRTTTHAERSCRCACMACRP
jgi:hypothetical protein